MSAHITEQRKGAPPSEGLLARLCVMMDLLIRNGVDPEDAAQRIMRALLKAGVPGPSEGGDARGWKRLQIWHSKFSARLALAPKKISAEAKAEYDRFAAEVDALPLNGRMELVIEGGLWDRRFRESRT